MSGTLRRLAQTNNAATSSPRAADPGSVPSTPRNRVSIGAYRSPASTPSISSSIPFDWDAARSRKPPPYGTPNQKSRSNGSATPVKRVVRKKGFVERITAIPSRIAFEIALFPNNVPLPAPSTAARLAGGFLHFVHLCVRVSQTRKVPDSDVGWEDMYREDEGASWFDWTTPVTGLLIAASVLNAVYLFTRIRLYRLHQRPDLVSSPNARFVSAQLDFEPLELPPLGSRITSTMQFVFSYTWRWLLHMKLPTRGQATGKAARVQQLEVWAPGEHETVLFTVYSPAHALLWIGTSSTNWITILIVMCLVSVQLHGLTYSYSTLVKDKEIIAAEVMSEYNEGFVYPRVRPVRKDVAVMTHESEISYASDGSLRDPRGCLGRDRCRFTHPDDPSWKDATPSRHHTRPMRPPTPPPVSRSPTYPPPITPVSLSLHTPISFPPSTPALPPPPTPPASLQRKSIPQKSTEQLKLLWEERIKTIAETTNRRKQLQQIETEIVNTRLLLDASAISTIPSDSKSRIDNELVQLERKRDQINKQREDSIIQLINSDSWPTAPLTDAQDKELARYSDLIENVAELKKQADDINTILKQLNGDENAMVVDPPEAGSRHNPAPEVVPEPGPTLADLEAMSERFNQLHSRFISFQNDVEARDADLQHDLQYQIQEALDEYSEASQKSPEKHNPLQATISKMDDDLGYLAQEMASQLGMIVTQSQETQAVKERLEAAKADTLRLQQQFLAYQESREKDRKTIAAMEAAIQAYTNNPPPPPAEPGLTQEQLIQLMEEPLLDVVRATIQPLIEQLRSQVQEMFNTQNASMYKTLWNRLSLTLRMVETISRRLDRIDKPPSTSAGNTA